MQITIWFTLLASILTLILPLFAKGTKITSCRTVVLLATNIEIISPFEVQIHKKVDQCP